MKNFIAFTSWATIISSSIVLVMTGMKGYGVDINQDYISLAANVMYSFFLLASLLILFREYKDGNTFWLVIFGLPVDVLILSLILPLFNIRFHPVILLTFDVYIIIAFSMYLGIRYYHNK